MLRRVTGDPRGQVRGGVARSTPLRVTVRCPQSTLTSSMGMIRSARCQARKGAATSQGPWTLRVVPPSYVCRCPAPGYWMSGWPRFNSAAFVSGGAGGLVVASRRLVVHVVSPSSRNQPSPNRAPTEPGRLSTVPLSAVWHGPVGSHGGVVVPAPPDGRGASAAGIPFSPRVGLRLLGHRHPTRGQPSAVLHRGAPRLIRHRTTAAGGCERGDVRPRAAQPRSARDCRRPRGVGGR
jgi:hypothetical protein